MPKEGQGDIDLFGDQRATVDPKAHKRSKRGTSLYERDPDEAYFTPSWVPEVLLAAWPMRGPIAEPACGLGHIVRVLKAHDFEVISADLNDWGAEDIGLVQRDFLRDPLLGTAGGELANAVITNPPYDKTDEFVHQAIECVVFDPEREGQAAFLLNALWSTAQTRDEILSEKCCFAAKVEITRRIQWLDRTGQPLRKPNGKKVDAIQNHAWYVWDARHSGPPLLLRGRA